MDGNVREVIFVSTKTMENVPELVDRLIDLAAKHSFLKKQIPKAYYDLHEAVIKLRPSVANNVDADKTSGPVSTLSGSAMPPRR